MRWMIAVLGTALSACAATTGPAPVEFRKAAPPIAREATPAPMASAGESTPVIPAPDASASPPQPLWEAGPGVPLSAYALRPEEAKPFDPKSPPLTHRVAPGETLYDVASLYSASMRAFIELNALAPPFSLTEGAELRVPRPKLHTVQPGETLVSLSRTYSVDTRSLALLNKLSRPYRLATGDVIVLPMDARAVDAQPNLVQAVGAPPLRPVRGATPAPTGASGFTWPLRGAILARFGPAEGGRRLDGVDIAAREGEAFTAAAGGTVVYAGADLPGYGLLVLIQHPGGWVTAYARARVLRVKEGDRVARAQPLGEVGRIGSGAVRLHFQVRQGRAARDPLSVLPPV